MTTLPNLDPGVTPESLALIQSRTLSDSSPMLDQGILSGSLTPPLTETAVKEPGGPALQEPGIQLELPL